MADISAWNEVDDNNNAPPPVAKKMPLVAVNVATSMPPRRHLLDLDDWTAARQRNARIYDQLFSEAGLSARDDGLAFVGLPAVVTNRHIFNQYVVRVPERDRF
jgi:hypothetical protein